MRGTSARRRVIGLMVAPIAGMLGVLLTVGAMDGSIPDREEALIAGGLMYLVAIFLGVPLAAVFERREIGRARSYALGGAMILLLFVVSIYVAGVAWGEPQVAWPKMIEILAVFGAAGATMGISYWIIVRPDRRFRVDPEQIGSIFR